MGSAKYRGVFSTVGDIMSTMRNNLEYCGVFSTVGDIMSTMGVILSSVGVFNTVGDIMMHVGEYHEYCGGVQYCGGIPSFEIWVPWGISCYMWGISGVLWGCSVPWGTQITKDFPHGTEHPPWYSWYPPRYWTPPRYSRYPPHLSWYSPQYWTPHSTQDIPHGTHDILHGTEYPPPYCTQIIQGDNSGHEEFIMLLFCFAQTGSSSFLSLKSGRASVVTWLNWKDLWKAPLHIGASK